MEKLKSVIAALNSIEVHGEKNLNLLLGCIQALNEVITEHEKAKKEAVEHEYDTGAGHASASG